MAKVTIQKPFEKPQGGSYIATIIDVIGADNVPVTFNGQTTYQNQVTFVWTLNKMDGSRAVDSEGRPYQVFETFNAFISTGGKQGGSKLYRALVQILNAAPPVINDTDQIEPLLLGKSSVLFLTSELKVGTNPPEYKVKVVGHSPLQPGQIAPTTPQGFVRKKFRQQQGQQQGTPAQQYQAPQQAPQQVKLDAGQPESF